ncbi:MAG TPA: YfhO family protein, partial [Chloroflexota bacterium]|nr:YfhO family protein [Chloroflexota bacterium]
PTLELSRHSYRQGGVPLEEAVAYGVERTHILETVLPTFWSLPSQEVTGYVGMVTLVLAVPAVALSGARRTVLALLGLALLSLTLAMGTYTPLYALLHRWLPQFDSFRAPGRWLLIWTFALAGLAAHGAQALRYRARSDQRERAALGYGVALFAVAAGLLFAIWRTNEVHAIQWLPHGRIAVLWLITALGASALGLISVFSRVPWPQVIMVGALMLELGFAAREMEYNRPGDPDLHHNIPAVATHVWSQMGQVGAAGATTDRLVSLAIEERLDGERLRRAVPQGDGEHRRYAAMREVLRPNHGVTLGLPSIDGYDGGLLPLRDYARFKALLVSAETPVPHFTLGTQAGGRADAMLYASLNVRYLLTDGRSGAPGQGWVLRENAPGAAWLYENSSVLPRAFLVGQTIVEPDIECATARLHTVDLATEAVVERPLLGTPSSVGAGQGSVHLTAAKTGELAMRVETDAESLLVVTETFYPGWRATVDGRPISIHRANVLFRSIVIPPGTHDVRLWYDPLSFKIGVGLTLMAVAGNAALMWRSRRRQEGHRAR